MQKNSIYLGVAVFLMALACVGCSTENPVSPISPEDGAQVNEGSGADKEYRWISVSGEVHLRHGAPAYNTPVVIQNKIGDGPWVTRYTANTYNNPNASFYAFNLMVCDDGTLFRCISLNDIVEKEVILTSDHYYFSLTQQLPRPEPDDFTRTP